MAVSTEQKQWIKATIPALELGGETLTTHFYKLMFSKYPVTATFFNPTHQQKGTQPRALANAVLAYAKHIDNPAVLMNAVTLIVNKHVALGVKPQHYPIVGECLLQAMKEVLGAAATPEIIDAWAAAYEQLADMLINAEATLYAKQAMSTGGWEGQRAFKITAKEQESELVTSFYLQPVDEKEFMLFKPGQYITVHLEIDGNKVTRNYSLSDSPNGQHYRISVKREDGGVVSTFLHKNVNVGDTLKLGPPCGEFVLDNSIDPVVLITAGVGLTPAISMLKAAAGKRDIRFIHACKNKAQHSFAALTEQLSAEYSNLETVYIYENVEGQIKQHHIENHLSNDAQVYFLGPIGFMSTVKNIVGKLGVPAERQHFEFFGPAQAI
ncbi:NO-inducible flavohemoprotein [Limnobacter parvus]|uniref:nitric oxide dioxygenase n=1 Tax=Limnobacter parvus TaxID=2939690 RepID=A0ABT1XHT5_9BURK|nr:NO-inducible flavohemoprotein [Limnobacter parvus]MCR2746845.1 NO-inducible flavohemoprotein [Limnobacter parvus]